MRERFDLRNRELLSLFRKKLEEDGFSPDPRKFRVNLGRTEREIREMNARVRDEFFPVLSADEQKRFSMQRTLDELNRILKDVE